MKAPLILAITQRVSIQRRSDIRRCDGATNASPEERPFVGLDRTSIPQSPSRAAQFLGEAWEVVALIPTSTKMDSDIHHELGTGHLKSMFWIVDDTRAVAHGLSRPGTSLVEVKIEKAQGDFLT